MQFVLPGTARLHWIINKIVQNRSVKMDSMLPCPSLLFQQQMHSSDGQPTSLGKRLAPGSVYDFFKMLRDERHC
jgi:hypothetical protein